MIDDTAHRPYSAVSHLFTWAATLSLAAPMVMAQTSTARPDATSIQMVTMAESYCRTIDNVDMSGQDYYTDAADAAAKSGKVIQSHNGGNCCTAAFPWNGSACAAPLICAAGTEAVNGSCVATAASCAAINKILVNGACVVASPPCTVRAMQAGDFTRYGGYAYSRYGYPSESDESMLSYSYNWAVNSASTFYRLDNYSSAKWNGAAQTTISQISEDRATPGRFHIFLSPVFQYADSGGYYTCARSCGGGHKVRAEFYLGANPSSLLVLNEWTAAGAMFVTVNGTPVLRWPSNADRLTYLSYNAPSRGSTASHTYQITGSQTLKIAANAATNGGSPEINLSSLLVPGTNTIEATWHPTGLDGVKGGGARLTLTSSSCH